MFLCIYTYTYVYIYIYGYIKPSFHSIECHISWMRQAKARFDSLALNKTEMVCNGWCSSVFVLNRFRSLPQCVVICSAKCFSCFYAFTPCNFVVGHVQSCPMCVTIHYHVSWRLLLKPSSHVIHDISQTHVSSFVNRACPYPFPVWLLIDPGLVTYDFWLWIAE